MVDKGLREGKETKGKVRGKKGVKDMGNGSGKSSAACQAYIGWKMGALSSFVFH